MKTRSFLRNGNHFNPNLLSCSAALLIAMLGTLLTPRPSLASCTDPKPKNWSAGPITVTSPTGTTPSLVVCVGQSVSVSVSTSNKDHWEIRCKTDDHLVDSGDDTDPLNYQWKGPGGFTNTTSSSTSWTAPSTPGKYNLTCTVDDVPTAVNYPETGNRDSSAVPVTVSVCVLAPGTPPSSVNTVTYVEHHVTPSYPAGFSPANLWGLTSPTRPTPEFGAVLDCSDKKWKLVTTKATSDYDIWYTLITSAHEANLGDANEGNYCDMLHDLRLDSHSTLSWYMVSAIESHERVHVASWKRVINTNFATAKGTIEGLSVDATCDKDASSANTELQNLPAFSTAVDTMNRNITAQWKLAIDSDHAGPCYQAERSVDDARISAIQTLATANRWKPCP